MVRRKVQNNLKIINYRSQFRGEESKGQDTEFTKWLHCLSVKIKIKQKLSLTVAQGIRLSQESDQYLSKSFLHRSNRFPEQFIFRLRSVIEGFNNCYYFFSIHLPVSYLKPEYQRTVNVFPLCWFSSGTACSSTVQKHARSD